MDKNNLRKRTIKNGLFNFLVFSLVLISVAPLFLIFYYIFKQGVTAISWDFLVNTPRPVGEVGGGIANAIVGSLMLVFIASFIALPVGITGGVFLYEYKKNKIAYWVRLIVEIIQGIPSIVIGIIAYVWVVMPMGGFSAFSGGVALSIMMLPMVIRSTEETLLMTPDSIKEASLALGVPYYRTIIKVTIPAALSGIVTGILLSISRIIGETAPLLFTAFGSDYMNYNALKPVSSLPHIIFTYATSPYATWHELAWAASLVLIIIVLLINLFSKMLSDKWKIQY